MKISDLVGSKVEVSKNSNSEALLIYYIIEDDDPYLETYSSDNDTKIANQRHFKICLSANAFKQCDPHE